MRSQRELVPFLFILAVFCSTGFSLMCYNCLNPVSQCKTNTSCTPNLDSCLIAVSGKLAYHQCWKFSDCNFEFISTRLELPKMQYRCCQEDMCNDKLQEKNHADSLSGKMVLLVTSALAVIWNFCF
ncbi:CD59 glycoprotein [Nannospalax galili]|uniref:MAC-inhibitory protein n=1 Tax=Nannospalax galili TaxID=1026970 RepID=A0A8C6S0R9_NANGA|nr:CD59 glycoprotein [Nannospalax galili]XP_008849857.1 CD59 glycoprotein [Nannospalax galili]